MQRLLLAFICLFIFVASGSSEDLGNDLSVNLESSNIVYSLGSIEKDSLIEKSIRVRNNLDQPLAVKETRSTCECMESFTEEQIVERGMVFTVDISLDTIGMGPGDIEEVLYILTDNMGYEIIRFALSATVAESK